MKDSKKKKDTEILEEYKISKENRENNYIYSDVYFPKALMKKKYQKEKQKPTIYKGQEKLNEIKELINYMKEKKQILEILEDNGEKMKCLQFLTEYCAF